MINHIATTTEDNKALIGLQIYLENRFKNGTFKIESHGKLYILCAFGNFTAEDELWIEAFSDGWVSGWEDKLNHG